MPFNANQLVVGANYQLDYFLKNDPIDQINTNHPLYSELVKRKVERLGGNEFVTEQVRFTNDSNFQNYFGADQVTYNEKDRSEEHTSELQSREKLVCRLLLEK